MVMIDRKALKRLASEEIQQTYYEYIAKIFDYVMVKAAIDVSEQTDAEREEIWEIIELELGNYLIEEGIVGNSEQYE